MIFQRLKWFHMKNLKNKHTICQYYFKKWCDFLRGDNDALPRPSKFQELMNHLDTNKRLRLATVETNQ